ncbi:MAG: TolC family protein [Oscillospiraceae bacterium]|nr:TolC family protein [Oscillospiraceae bacterium]
MKPKQYTQRLLCLVLTAALLSSLTPRAGAASRRVLQLAQAQSMAIANSPAISRKTNEIILKQMKYVEAVDGIKAKVKNLRSFRWSPLLSFKFPQQLDMVTEYELNVKPLTLQAEIDTLNHERNDLRYAALNSASKAYIEVYLLQEKITFNETRLANAQEELTRNQARLVTGQATQNDVDTMQAAIDNLTTDLASQKRSFQTAKETLSDLIGLDVTSGYIFRNPLKELTLPRSMLDSVIQHTLDHDQNFYAAKMTASTALMNLNSYESLMRNQYGSKLNYIQTFVDMAKNGQDIDYSAFMLKYKEMLVALDRPWSFTIRILFFRFTMEWFKGEIDGTRYIEDEIYAIYTACMEYANAKKDRDSAEKDLRKQVAAQYELLVNAWSSYEHLAGLVAASKTTMEKVTALNQQGKADYTELKTAREDYESMQLDALDALSSYNTMLYDFDRLTCGAVTNYMKGVSMGAETGTGGDSFSRLDPIHDPYYYIYTTVEDLTFHIGVSIPDGFDPAVTDFEVWNDQIQIGARTPVTQELSHLTLDYGGDALLTLRFYDSGNYVGECEIDATVPRDTLSFGAAPVETTAQAPIGTYEISTAAIGGLSTTTLTLHLNRDVGASTFTISYGTNQVFTSDPTPVEESFQYLTLLAASLEEVTLELYDRDGTLIQTARFDTTTQTLFAVPAG